MDQQAFRQLLSTPAPGASSASSSNAATGSSSGARQFGLARKREQPSSTLSSSIKASELAPRKVASAQAPKPKPVLPKGYVDRAEARRLGKDDANEYADVDKLREDFERRKEGLSEEDRRMLEEQMAFLGGDAKHSVLVKGLDFALLAQERAKEAGGGQVSSATDDDLEAAFAGAGGPKAGPDDRTRSGTAAGTETGILEELAKRNLSGSSKLKSHEDTRGQGAFGPIASGFKPIGSGKDKMEAPEYIWKDGKRMRKKRKKVEASEQELGHSNGTAHTNTKAESSTEAAPAKAKPLPSNNRPRAANNSAASSSKSGKTTASNHPANTPAVRERTDQATLLSAHASTSRTSAHALASTPATAPVVAPLAANLDDDEDEDIFAGVGSWQGIQDSDSDAENSLSKGDKSKEAEASQSDLTKANLPRDSSNKRAGMDWFRNDKAVDKGEAQGFRRSTSAHGEQEEEEEDEATRLIRASERAVAAPARKVSASAVDASPPPPSSMRLQGFSDSVMSSEMSRAVLERERLAEAKREQRKKERMQGEGGGTEQKKRKKNKFGGANDDD
ncbi:hypothetical protein IE81DRAFT_344364 [Ceraceosorus guamensis]|uniref:RED-like N-terminal domain-containing protein n=1 Tax=Ceraceosorus guamensis TaxID=1522189 RepID=A0A316W7I8_9BASI|nr:hypothetical protein IE81DRAFT_344364 [Ceraceosorus guamensis]PWN45886.1 hypothetical protein IE81DRAFT_344364 [Ceraceosorus guamensis]